LLRLGCHFGSGELLSVERNFGDADGGEALAMSLQLLVLFLALEVEDENLIAATFFHNAADHTGAALRFSDGPRFPGDCQYVGELDIAVLPGLLVNFNHVPGRDAKLLSPGADDRVHRLFLLYGSCLLIPTSRQECGYRSSDEGV